MEAQNAHFTIEHNSPKGFLKTDNPAMNSWDNRIIRTPDHTFLTIQGSGLLYKISDKTADSLLLKRLDKTFFFGYNFYSIFFEYKGDIYSFGGEGFWRINGQLRVFNGVKKEWDIVPINEEIPATSKAYFFDQSTGKLYYCSWSYNDAVTKKNVEADEWYILDMNTKTNTKIGPIHSEIKNIIHHQQSVQRYACYALPSLNGSIITDHEVVFKFVNFKNLTMYDITDRSLLQSIKATSYGKIENCFSIDSTIYITLPNEQKLDSIRVTASFYAVQSAKSILHQTTIPWTKGLLFLIPILLLLMGIINYRLKIKEKAIIETPTIESNQLYFDSQEEELLERIKQKETDGLSIPEVNDLLGLSKKPLAIQKKNRNEVIQKINSKFKLMHDTEEDLIIRKRDENDKRSFIYFLNETMDVDYIKNQH